MPAPREIEELPNDPMLPWVFGTLAWATLLHPLATPDHLLVLADACDEAVSQAGFDHQQNEAIAALATELRLRSPDYA